MKLSKNFVISAVSNLSTAYNLLVINVVHVLVENQYTGGSTASSSGAVSMASTACLVGAIVGQLTLGYVGDCLGRPRALQITMALSVLGALASAFAVPLDAARPETIFHFLSITRFVLGVGVGGVYPLSATIASEAASKESRGRTASLVFSMQGVASLLVPLLAMLLVALCGTPKVDARGDDLGLSWRLLLGLGALPGILLAPFKARSASAEEAKRNSNINGAAQGPTAPLAAFAADAPPPAAPPAQISLLQALRIRKYWGKLVGTAGGWFFFDITFYGNSLFQPTVLHSVFHSKDSKGGGSHVTGGLEDNLCLQMLCIAAIGLPGYYVSVWLMDSLGRWIIQMQGFLFTALAFAALGLFDAELKHVPVLMLVVYGLTFFFSNFGPNSTTFILPAETFPAHVRTTLNGFSAAMGKLGATVGAALFVPLTAATSVQTVLLACAGVSWLGALVTWAFVEDRRGKRVDHAEVVAAESRAVTPGGGALEQCAADDRDRDERLGPPAA